MRGVANYVPSATLYLVTPTVESLQKSPSTSDVVPLKFRQDNAHQPRLWASPFTPVSRILPFVLPHL